MDDLELLFLLVLLIPIAAVAALVMAILNWRHLNRIEARLAGIERRLQGATAPAIEFETAPRPAAPEGAAEPAEGTAEPEDASEPPPSLPEAERRQPVVNHWRTWSRQWRHGDAGSPAKAAAVRPAAAKRDFEETLGTRWTVWVGGLALALGGVFLVRYAIERDLIGPGMRIFLGTLFSLALLGAGEWMRRKESTSPIIGVPSAHIPGVLTAAGTVAGFATAYAAHALYGFIGPAVAFVLLGAIAVATMVASALHGPWLAGLGLVGAYGTPALVSTDTPNAPALFLYLAVVTFAALWLARARHWRWLAIASGVAAVVWGFLYIDATQWRDFDMASTALYAAALLALAILFLVRDVHRDTRSDEDAAPDWLAVGLIAAIALLGLAGIDADHYGAASLVLALGGTAAILYAAWRWPPVLFAAAAAGALVAFGYFGWGDTLSLAGPPETLAPELAGTPRLRSEDFVRYLGIGLCFAGLFAGAGFFAMGRGLRRDGLLAALWAAIAVTVPLVLLIIGYRFVAEFERSLPFAAAALALAALYGGALEAAVRRTDEDGAERLLTAPAALAAGALAALGLALTIALEKGFLTVALALLALGLAWIARARPVTAFRPLAVIVGLVVLGRMWWDPAIVGDDLGTTPLFNWITYGYGVPAIAFAGAAIWFGRQKSDLWARALEALALVFVTALVVMEIRHFMTGGDIFGAEPGLAEQGLYSAAALALAIGVNRLHGLTGSPVFSWATLVLGVVGFVAIVVQHFVVLNPLITGDSVGSGFLFNDLLVAYLLPALLAAALYLVAKDKRPATYVKAAGALALILAFAYLSLMVRHAFQGENLAIWHATEDAESYTYSLVWLIFGLALLIAGIVAKSRTLRAASAVVILIAVFKVFLIDMSGLTGIFRALSFMGLGAVLIGIGLIYQRLLFATRRPPADDA